VINAGDGGCNHPTQALTDCYTVWRAFGGSTPFPDRPLRHAVVGDIMRSRTIRSYVELMSRQDGAAFHLFDTRGAGSKYIVRQNPRACVTGLGLDALPDILPQCDVVYLNRLQTERWDGGGEPEPFVFTPKLMDLLPGHAVVLNPGPRREEIPDELVEHPQVLMQKQVRNGLYVRMALLKLMAQGESMDAEAEAWARRGSKMMKQWMEENPY
jgi:aspartate carbamoyltransferase catalytic subunit